ncbi:branched-chain amino acid ABC transporter permease [Catenuloplanes japonicus]|uniref:branched-chain amino acid ABC transporter permease n=1 Tax=Catenuloplanes japonicus TaxID=33876 RepID=UPI0005256CD0|nr:branched-chain amino acid ABC transporter permease [Catenuloplanes japonicus]
MGTVGMWVVTGVDGVAFGMLLFTAAIGLTLIFGVMGVLNLAHGVFYLAGAYLAYLIADGSLLLLAGAFAAAVVLGATAGAGLAVALAPVRGHLDQALVTLGLAFLAADVFTTVFGAGPQLAEPPEVLAGHVMLGGYGYPVYRLVFIAVAGLLAVVLHLVVRHTTAGILLRATVADPAMSAAMGVRPGRVQTAAMAVGGSLAVVAGVLGAPVLGPAPGVDATVLVLALIIVVLGGAGSVPGTAAGALLVGQVQTTGTLLASAAAPFVLFAALLVVLVVRGRRQPQAAGSPA